MTATTVRAKGPSRADQLQFLRDILDSGVPPQRRIAVDAGANRGDWTDVLRGCFGHVIAVEPGGERRALKTRAANWGNVAVVDAVLGHRRARWCTSAGRLSA